jgi:predicted tellurium resistance membrane protein TerC
MDWLTDPQIWIALATLTFLEIVLGVDNVIFISILSGKLPESQQPRARRLGLLGAMVTRVLLLFSLAWIIRLTQPWFEVLGQAISGRDLILILGGLFLLGKSTYEIHDKLEGEQGHASARVPSSFASVIVQIMLLDVVFSLDSVITAVGMVDVLWVMVAAVVIAVLIMMLSAEPISAFVHKHPTVKMLALSFLLLIGLSLLLEGFDHHIPKGYIYFAMGFSVFVEMINLRLRKTTTPVDLHDRYTAEEPGEADQPRGRGSEVPKGRGTEGPGDRAAEGPKDRKAEGPKDRKRD